MTTRRPSVAFIGAGRAGLGLALALRARGCRVTAIAARRVASARRAARRLGLPRAAAVVDPAAAAGAARIVIIAVPDARIADVATALAASPRASVRDTVVLHTSGAVGSAPLRLLKRRGASVGSLHPLVSFPPAGSRCDLSGVAFAVDGDAAAVRAARALARRLGGAPIAIRGRDRAAYHLAATMVASGLAALLDAGIDLAGRRARLGERRARSALMPLARSVIANVAGAGARRALTGPSARGDRATVGIHLEVLADEPPQVRRLYRLLCLRAVAMAQADGRLDAPSARRMRRRLGSD